MARIHCSLRSGWHAYNELTLLTLLILIAEQQKALVLRDMKWREKEWHPGNEGTEAIDSVIYNY